MQLRVIVSALCSVVLLACGFADLFTSKQVGNVVVTYDGPTNLSVAARAPLLVTVTIDGAAVPDPRLAVTSANPAILAFAANGDTIVALSKGFDTLTIKLVASIYTDSFPTIRQQIHVNP